VGARAQWPQEETRFRYTVVVDWNQEPAGSIVATAEISAAAVRIESSLPTTKILRAWVPDIKKEISRVPSVYLRTSTELIRARRIEVWRRPQEGFRPARGAPQPGPGRARSDGLLSGVCDGDWRDGVWIWGRRRRWRGLLQHATRATYVASLTRFPPESGEKSNGGIVLTRGQ
jgi:hypothetical protein